MHDAPRTLTLTLALALALALALTPTLTLTPALTLTPTLPLTRCMMLLCQLHEQRGEVEALVSTLVALSSLHLMVGTP